MVADPAYVQDTFQNLTSGRITIGKAPVALQWIPLSKATQPAQNNGSDTHLELLPQSWKDEIHGEDFRLCWVSYNKQYSIDAATGALNAAGAALARSQQQTLSSISSFTQATGFQGSLELRYESTNSQEVGKQHPDKAYFRSDLRQFNGSLSLPAVTDSFTFLQNAGFIKDALLEFYKQSDYRFTLRRWYQYKRPTYEGNVNYTAVYEQVLDGYPYVLKTQYSNPEGTYLMISLDKPSGYKSKEFYTITDHLDTLPVRLPARIITPDMIGMSQSYYSDLPAFTTGKLKDFPPGKTYQSEVEHYGTITKSLVLARYRDRRSISTADSVMLHWEVKSSMATTWNLAGWEEYLYFYKQRPGTALEDTPVQDSTAAVELQRFMGMQGVITPVADNRAFSHFNGMIPEIGDNDTLSEAQKVTMVRDNLLNYYYSKGHNIELLFPQYRRFQQKQEKSSASKPAVTNRDKTPVTPPDFPEVRVSGPDFHYEVVNPSYITLQAYEYSQGFATLAVIDRALTIWYIPETREFNINNNLVVEPITIPEVIVKPSSLREYNSSQGTNPYPTIIWLPVDIYRQSDEDTQFSLTIAQDKELGKDGKPNYFLSWSRSNGDINAYTGKSKNFMKWFY